MENMYLQSLKHFESIILNAILREFMKTYIGTGGDASKLYFSIISRALEWEIFAGQPSSDRGSKVVFPFDKNKRPVVSPMAQIRLAITPATAPWVM
jgi:hypothetical protein